jgi:hypothetical protein
VKPVQHPPQRKHRHLQARRADLLSLISEMERNQSLQAAGWQLESLRQMLLNLDRQLSLARRTGVKESPGSIPGLALMFPASRNRRPNRA